MPTPPPPHPRKIILLCGHLYGQVPDYFEQAMIIIQLMDALTYGLYSYSEKVSWNLIAYKIALSKIMPKHLERVGDDLNGKVVRMEYFV